MSMQCPNLATAQYSDLGIASKSPRSSSHCPKSFSFTSPTQLCCICPGQGPADQGPPPATGAGPGSLLPSFLPSCVIFGPVPPTNHGWKRAGFHLQLWQRCQVVASHVYPHNKGWNLSLWLPETDPNSHSSNRVKLSVLEHQEGRSQNTWPHVRASSAAQHPPLLPSPASPEPEFLQMDEVHPQPSCATGLSGINSGPGHAHWAQEVPL